MPAPALRRSGLARTSPSGRGGHSGEGRASGPQGGQHAAALIRLLELPTKTFGVSLGIDIGGGSEALLVSLERTSLSLFPAAQRQLRRRGNPSLSNLAGMLCMVAADGDPLCVHAKCKELASDSIRKY
jgi:hypothetical protein